MSDDVYQNMDPNPSVELDDDHNKFRARLERIATLSLRYDPNLLQASPASSTVSRSPLQPVKIRTDWSRPDLDDEGDSELNSSGIYKFSLANLDDSQISQDGLKPTSEQHEPSFVLNAGDNAVEVITPTSTEFLSGIRDLQNESFSRFSDILVSSDEEDESDMELSSTCGAILLERHEGEPDEIKILDGTDPALGESITNAFTENDETLQLESRSSSFDGEAQPENPSFSENVLSEPTVNLVKHVAVAESGEIIEPESKSASVDGQELSVFPSSSAMVELRPIIDPVDGSDGPEQFVLHELEDHASRCEGEGRSNESESSSQPDGVLSTSDPENIIDYANLSPKKPVHSRVVEGTPARTLFPDSSRSADGTPVKVHPLVVRAAQVSASFHVESTPSKRHRAIDQVQSEVPDLLQRLNSKHEDWTRRIEALKRISRFTTFNISPSALADACLPLVESLALQLQDLRSQIVKQACITIGDLSECLGFQFHLYARPLFPKLLDLLRIAKKVMSSAGDNCLRRIIAHSHVDAIDILIQESVSNKSPIVRCRCVELITLALQKWNVAQLAIYKPSISNLFSKVCCDSTKDVRTAGKRMFSEFAPLWPDDSRDLFKAFDPKLQKAILTDHPQLHDVVASCDQAFLKSGFHDIEPKTPMRLSLSEVKAKMRRESIANSSAHDDIIFENPLVNIAVHSPLRNLSAEFCSQSLTTPTKSSRSQFDVAAVSVSQNIFEHPPRSPSLSFKFDQSHPSLQHDRGRLAQSLSPLPPEFLEGFPVPVPLRQSIASEGIPVMCEPSPLVKHSTRRFTSRVLDTPVNGKFDERDGDDDSTSSASSCPTVEQCLDEADDNDDVSVSSSIVAESDSVLARDIAPMLSPNDDLDRRKEKMLILENKLQYLRTMATSVFDEVDCPLRTIEIHHDLTSASLAPVSPPEQLEDDILPIAASSKEESPAVFSPERNDFKCDSVLKVGDYSFEASKSPKDVLSAVLLTPSSERVFKSPDSTPVAPPSDLNIRRSQPSRDLKDGEDASLLRSIFFTLLSLIAFAVLFHGLPAFLKPGSDDLVSRTKLHVPTTNPSFGPPPELPQKIGIPIRDSSQLSLQPFDIDESSASVATTDPANTFCDSENSDSTNAGYLQTEPTILDFHPFVESQGSVVDEIPRSHSISDSAPSSDDIKPAAFCSDCKDVSVDSIQPVAFVSDSQVVTEFSQDTTAEENGDFDSQPSSEDAVISSSSNFDTPVNLKVVDVFNFVDNATLADVHSSVLPAVSFGNSTVTDSLDGLQDESEQSDSQSSDFFGDIRLTPKFAWVYSLIVAGICLITYRARMFRARVQSVERDPDFDLTGVTMAPEWDINLDSVLPSGPSPLPQPGGTDFQKWNHIKKDGTSMTLFSPLRRTLRIRRPRRPTQF